MTYWLGKLDCNLGHSYECAIEVLHSPLCLLGALVAHVADTAGSHELDISNCAARELEVLAKACLVESWGQAPDKDAGRLHVGRKSVGASVSCYTHKMLCCVESCRRLGYKVVFAYPAM